MRTAIGVLVPGRDLTRIGDLTRSHWSTPVHETPRAGGGVAAPAHQPPPGMTPRLSAEQRAHLPTLLARGAPAYGFTGDVWTAKRVAAVSARTFGVRYHPDHVSRQ